MRFNLDENLGKYFSEFKKEVDLENVFCRSAKIKPLPNSIAEKIKKKKVNANIFISSKRKPENNANTYNVIQINSAVIRAWIIELAFKVKMTKSKVNIKIIKFNSDMDKYIRYDVTVS